MTNTFLTSSSENFPLPETWLHCSNPPPASIEYLISDNCGRLPAPGASILISVETFYSKLITLVRDIDTTFRSTADQFRKAPNYPVTRNAEHSLWTTAFLMRTLAHQKRVRSATTNIEKQQKKPHYLLFMDVVNFVRAPLMDEYRWRRYTLQSK